MIIQWVYTPDTGGAQGADAFALGVSANYFAGTAMPAPLGIGGCKGIINMGLPTYVTRMAMPGGEKTSTGYGKGLVRQPCTT